MFCVVKLLLNVIFTQLVVVVVHSFLHLCCKIVLNVIFYATSIFVAVVVFVHGVKHSYHFRFQGR